MKKIFIVVLALGLVFTAFVYFAAVGRSPSDATPTSATTPPVGHPTPPKAPAVSLPAMPAVAAAPQPQVNNVSIKAMTTSQTTSATAVGYDALKTNWRQLRNDGKLDQAIAELEKMAADNPGSTDILNALARGYMEKTLSEQDITQMGYLGMKIDQTFAASLQLDPANWPAQYLKAVALSNWPAQMHKSQEVIDTFQSLIQQQEAETPQPQFADTYLRLGDEYAKQGDNALARETWKRGLEQFPANQDLQQKLINTPGK